jgi:hypothetical protein
VREVEGVPVDLRWCPTVGMWRVGAGAPYTYTDATCGAELANVVEHYLRDQRERNAAAESFGRLA